MDWGRAKNVLIYSFLLLNLLLCYQLWTDLREQAGANLDFTSLSGPAQQIMEQKDIRILCPIPAATPQLPDITYRYSAGEGDGTVQLARPVDSKLIFSFTELSRELKSQIPDIENYRFDPLESEVGKFVLHPLVDGKWPLFSVRLELVYNNQRIVAYRQPQIDIGESGKGKAQKVLPASKALGSLIEKFFPQGAAVKEIELGYYGELFNSESQVAAPMWRFLLEDGKSYYVNGISADIISPKTAE
ncbi:regulatory protein YycI of two-component signal transduction system YycFG [Paenibacillus forsythiae]|uniref:Regulatory protein YycI of two-component signal transduction system YycFG n=1 Tax=Paenibacillus forsythiae TaxID=365616 RepID=A0ABU3H357_9BACL|nr:two-component system regulatory protein YycI [Paenibacillus forsythiae]MDT3425261.1 regulatory protein YycI of two-component signal transduction system YycFG [Paenibacillus forsythiae]